MSSRHHTSTINTFYGGFFLLFFYCRGPLGGILLVCESAVRFSNPHNPSKNLHRHCSEQKKGEISNLGRTVPLSRAEAHCVHFVFSCRLTKKETRSDVAYQTHVVYHVGAGDEYHALR